LTKSCTDTELHLFPQMQDAPPHHEAAAELNSEELPGTCVLANRQAIWRIRLRIHPAVSAAVG